MHVLFTTCDLLNCKQSVGAYRENSEKVYQPLKTIMLTHNPNWGDIQALLDTFFTTEEIGIRKSQGREYMIKC